MQKFTHTQSREHVSRLLIELDVIRLDGGFIGDEDDASLPPLVLQLERDAPNRTLVDALHEMGRESGNLVAKALGRDYGNLLEVYIFLLVRKSRVIPE
ncbi:hypothetical protein SLEP1_g46718 [Rubroshorea leprosula]|uniref:Uncharacterized protein n=1 Tax=Rubroshorea leprosula TaxID=152421 RepID=A0AAV5LQM3_9ROSI|nr:hypothetical protein SLEP1_g46718 [Rubroshorea leprosula]